MGCQDSRTNCWTLCNKFWNFLFVNYELEARDFQAFRAISEHPAWFNKRTSVGNLAWCKTRYQSINVLNDSWFENKMKAFSFDLLLAVNFLCCLGLEGEKFGDSKRSIEDEWLDPGNIFEYDRGKRVIHYFPLLPSFFKTICDELFSLEHRFYTYTVQFSFIILLRNYITTSSARI